MKNVIYKMRYVALLLALTSMVFLTACDDEESSSDEIVLLSFGPSGVHHGDEITFIGENLDQVTAVVFQPGVEVSKSAFTDVTDKQFALVLPESVEAGKVILKTPDGDIESITMLNLEVPVTVTSVTEEAKPGTNITITGEMVNWIETVTFAADEVVEKDDFVSQSLTEVVVTVPEEAKTGFLSFTTGGTEPLQFSSEEQLIVTLPTVTDITPAAVLDTRNIVITGTDLDLVKTVTFPGGTVIEQANFVDQDVTSLEVQVPLSSLDGKLILHVASGLSITTAGSIDIVLPVINTVTPALVTPGNNVTLTGTNIDRIASLKFSDGTLVAAANFVSQSATQIVVTVPASVTKNGILIVTNQLGFVTSTGAIAVPGGGPSPLAVVFFDDGFASGWQDWSWGAGRVSAPTNTEQKWNGNSAWKYTYPGGGTDSGLQWGNGNTAIGGNANFVIAVYGGPGSDGLEMEITLNDFWGGTRPKIVINEGEWTEYEIPFTAWVGQTVGTSVTRLAVKPTTSSWNGTVWVDWVGFR
ncbi:MAG TPA: IPT/TIG domain-containing protein [Ohtaekwangia sp.]